MRIFKKTVGLALILALLLTMTACVKEPVQQILPTETMAAEKIVNEIVFSKKYLNVAEMSPEEWIENLEKIDKGQYAELCVREDGESVSMKLTQSQTDFWKQDTEGRLSFLAAEMKGLKAGYDLSWSQDYTLLKVSYNQELELTSAVYYILMAEVLCAFGQMLDGVGAEDWYVAIEIINSDTGKTVTTGDSEIGLTYDASNWEASK